MYGSHHHLNDSLCERTFPQVVAAGGLSNLLRQRFNELKIALQISHSHERAHYANTSGSNGSVHVYASSSTGNFVVEIRRAGLSIGRILTDDIDDVARIFEQWLLTPIETSEFVTHWPECEIRPDIELIEPMGTRKSDWNCLLYVGGEWYELLQLLHNHDFFSNFQPNWSMRSILFFDSFENGPRPVNDLPTVTTKDGTYFVHDGDSLQFGPFNARETITKLEEYIPHGSKSE